MTVFGLLAGVLLGLGQPQLRGPLMFEESEARVFRQAADSLGFKTRLERSHQHGIGWEYSVWVHGFSSVAMAEAAAVRLADHTGYGVTVFGEGAAAGPPLPVELEELPKSDEVRQRVVRALGGVDGALNVLERTDALEFRFRRTLPQKSINARHLYQKAPGHEALSVEVTVGAGREEWRVVSGPSGAWILKSGDLAVLSGRGAHQLMEDSVPASLYTSSLMLPSLIVGDEDYAGLEVVGQEVVDRRNAIRMQSSSRHGRLELLVDAETWLPRSISFWSDAGMTQRLFLGWRAVESNLVLPEVVEIWGGADLWERIRLEKINLSPGFSDADFSVTEMP